MNKVREQEILRRYKNDPVYFVGREFKCEPDEWQKDVLTAFPANQRIAMAACKGPGKSTVLALLIWNYLLTRPHSQVACTSVTSANLSDGLWKELAKWQKKSKLLSSQFTWTKTRIYQNDHPETWFCSFRTWPKKGSVNDLTIKPIRLQVFMRIICCLFLMKWVQSPMLLWLPPKPDLLLVLNQKL